MACFSVPTVSKSGATLLCLTVPDIEKWAQISCPSSGHFLSSISDQIWSFGLGPTHQISAFTVAMVKSKHQEKCRAQCGPQDLIRLRNCDYVTCSAAPAGGCETSSSRRTNCKGYRWVSSMPRCDKHSCCPQWRPGGAVGTSASMAGDGSGAGTPPPGPSRSAQCCC